MRTAWTMAALGLLVFPACKDRGLELQQPEDQVKAEPAHAQGQQSGQTSQTSEVTGKLARATSSGIQLEDNAQPLKVDSGTQVTLDGQAASVGQLPAGSEVRASFRMESGEARATRIEAKSK